MELMALTTLHVVAGMYVALQLEGSVSIRCIKIFTKLLFFIVLTSYYCVYLITIVYSDF